MKIKITQILLLNFDQGVKSSSWNVKSIVCHYLLFFTLLVIYMLIFWPSVVPTMPIFVICTCFVSVFHISCFLLIDLQYTSSTGSCKYFTTSTEPVCMQVPLHFTTSLTSGILSSSTQFIWIRFPFL